MRIFSKLPFLFVFWCIFCEVLARFWFCGHVFFLMCGKISQKSSIGWLPERGVSIFEKFGWLPRRGVGLILVDGGWHFEGGVGTPFENLCGLWPTKMGGVPNVNLDVGGRYYSL